MIKRKLNWLQIVYGVLDIIIGVLFLFEAINDFNKIKNPDSTGAALVVAILFIFIMLFLFGILFIIYGLIFIFSVVKIKEKVILKRWMIINILIL